MQRLEAVLAALDGDKNKLVIDLSCRRSSQSGSGSSTWFVAMNKWQTVTEMEITQGEFFFGPGRRYSSFTSWALLLIH